MTMKRFEPGVGFVDDPVTTTVTGELDAIAAGLDPAQESRADALTAAARLLAPALTDLYPVTVAENLTTIARLWIELAYHGDAWIADGHRPVDDDERDERRRP